MVLVRILIRTLFFRVMCNSSGSSQKMYSRKTYFFLYLDGAFFLRGGYIKRTTLSGGLTFEEAARRH